MKIYQLKEYSELYLVEGFEAERTGMVRGWRMVIRIKGASSGKVLVTAKGEPREFATVDTLIETFSEATGLDVPAIVYRV